MTREALPVRKSPWFGGLSVCPPILGLLGCCGVGITSYNPIRGNPAEVIFSSVVLLWCGLDVLGLVLAVVAVVRQEPRGLAIAGIAVNILLLLPLAWWWLDSSADSPYRHWREQQAIAIRAAEQQEYEVDAKNLRLKLSHAKEGDWLCLARTTKKPKHDNAPGGTYLHYQPVGVAGGMDYGFKFPEGVNVRVTWPEGRRFELNIKCSEEMPLKLEVADLLEVTAKLDGKAIALPLDLPPSKHHLEVKGLVPIPEKKK